MKKTLSSLAFITALMTASLASAHGPGNDHQGHFEPTNYQPGAHWKQREFADKIDRRLHRQWRRINKGVDSGQLTRKETKRLRKQNRRISNLDHQFGYDGWYSKWERHELVHALDRASSRIHRLKHNERRRYYHH
ncbi:MAG: hypothetical protein AAF493_16830 [Pseudomonadota bacterium]